MNRLATLLVALLVAGLLPARSAELPAAGVQNLDAFARLPVWENGRMMPLDTYARLKLKEFSGFESIRDKGERDKVVFKESAVSWLARVLFTPSSTFTNQIFLINDNGVVQAIGVDVRKSRHYSYDELRPGAQKLAELARVAGTAETPEAKAALTTVDREAYRVFESLTQYLMLTVACEFARPSPALTVANEELRAKLGLPAEQRMFNFMDLFERMGGMHEIVSAVATKPSEQWTPMEQEAMMLAMGLKNMSERYQGLQFTPFPAAPHGDQQFLSPWDALAFGRGDADLLRAVAALGKMANAYVLSRQDAFDAAAAEMVAATTARWPDKEKGIKRAAQEKAYNDRAYFTNAKAWYIVAFVIAFIAFVAQGNKYLRWTAFALILLALAYQVTGITWRVILTGRPPVTNLYGTFIFVSAACVILGLAVEWFFRNALGLFVSSLIGVVFLFIAAKFQLEGDTMGKLVAVLDSNFWLSTHVIAISLGYAGAWIAGVVAHVYLVLALNKPLHAPLMRSIHSAMNGVLAFGLTLSFLGTMLGGVWADQSWGRFWGWDPKENGALLIVLWTAVLYHARLGGMLREAGYAAGVAAGNLVVMAAWLGTNLLGVGLHSYGFTKGVTDALNRYFRLDALLILGLLVAVKMRRMNPVGAKSA
jgi:ABC-type transport system involved in cytochrome c biogenesis permease subunit